jgi:hypothetical protein
MSWLGDIFDGIGDFFSDAFEWVGDAFGDFFSNPVSLISGALALMGVPGPISMIFGEGGLLGGTAIGEMVGGLSGALSDFGSGLWETVSGGAQFLGDSLFGDGATQGLFDSVTDGFTSLFGDSGGAETFAATDYASPDFMPLDEVVAPGDGFMSGLNNYAGNTVDNIFNTGVPGATASTSGSSGFLGKSWFDDGASNGWFERPGDLVKLGLQTGAGLFGSLQKEAMEEAERDWQEKMVNQRYAREDQLLADQQAAKTYYGVSGDGSGAGVDPAAQLNQANQQILASRAAGSARDPRYYKNMYDYDTANPNRAAQLQATYG